HVIGRTKETLVGMRASVFLVSSMVNIAIRWNKACNHISTRCCPREDGLTKLRLGFTSVDCWEELFEPRHGPSKIVFRANARQQYFGMYFGEQIPYDGSYLVYVTLL